EQYTEARLKLLAAERELTKQREAVAAQRRTLPWVKIDKSYRFESADGPLGLADLFRGQSQLLIYHLMFAPDWEAACKSCTFWADSFDRIVPHLKARDVSFTGISRAPVPKLQAYARRLGWSFPWVSAGASDFNYDFAVSFTPEQIERGSGTYNYGATPVDETDLPGYSVLARDDAGAIFHTYSTFARGIDALNPVYQALDLVPKGRDEAHLKQTMSWVKRRDEY
ncbi:MAG TPA: DUF899 family protein, partial [Polyangiales bacterium]|nr:DUF899 family protein [Polyangiales bacterium]